MYIKINKLKIEVEEVNGFWNRFKCLMFKIDPLKNGFVFKKQKHFHTFYACQRIDAIITDKNNTILKVYNSCPSEKFYFPVKKGYYTYLLPNNSIQNLKKGDLLKVYK